MFLDLQQRWNRVNDTTHIIYYDDMSIHKVDYIQSLKDCVLVHTEGSLIYQDTDVFTLDEIYHAELGVDTIRTELDLR